MHKGWHAVNQENKQPTIVWLAYTFGHGEA